ncbi:CHASE3 domain-containing protein [Phormidium sp. CLA17]|nr:CHASE3 domain-containing protein [Leptolyngbya sp. Cla-17]
MRRSLKLNKATQAGFGTIIVMIIGIGAVSKISMNGLVESIGWVTHTHEVKANLKALEKDLADAETGQRGFIFTNKESFLEPYKQSKESLKTHFLELKKLISDNPQQIQRLNQVEELSQLKQDELAQTIVLKRKGQERELRELVLSEKGKKYMDDIRSKVDEMSNVEDQLLTERGEEAKRIEQFSTWVSISTTLVVISLGGLLLLFITNKVVRPLSQVASTIVSSSTEIAATVAQQEHTAQEQTAAVSQTTTTMDELGASSRQSTEQAETAAVSAQQIMILVDGKGQDNLSSGSSLRQKVGDIAEQMLRLSEQTGQIGIISTLVSDLANQTNMLALNAAVEAVRAGEHGKGFGVVAAEIRKLADQSKKSAERINVLVVDIKNATNSTVMVTDEGSKMVETIVSAVNNISLTSQQISLTAKQQALAIQQVGEAMNALNQGAVQTALGITQTKVGTQKLNDAALNLKAIV